MPTYRAVQARIGRFDFPAIVLNEETREGFQMYCGGGWFRRTSEWLDENSYPIDDAVVQGFVNELRGRGVLLVKEEVQSES